MDYLSRLNLRLEEGLIGVVEQVTPAPKVTLDDMQYATGGRRAAQATQQRDKALRAKTCVNKGSGDVVQG